MPLPPLVERFAHRLPSYDLMPRTRARYEALQAAREAASAARVAQESTAAADASGAPAAFPYAARDPKRTYTLSTGVHLSLQDRWAIFGTIGTGKTTLARELLAALARLYPMAARYILDSKGDGLFDEEEGLYEGDDLPPLAPPGGQVVWKPGRDDVDAYSEWFDRILKARQPCIVFVDELSSLSRGPRSHAEGFIRLIKQGRSLNQCVITLSQEAAGIPRQVRNQLMHLVRMRLEDDIDAARLDRLLQGASKPRREPLRPHGFWYRRLDRPDAPREFPDWRALLT